MPHPSTLGARLRELRELRGWRQRDLAAVIGTGQNRVGDWETGTHTPTLAALQRLADALDTTLSEILDGIRCEQQNSPRKGHAMNEDGEFDVNDLEEAFAQYSRRPRDVVPKVPYTGSNDDLVALDGQTVEVTHFERSDDGVTERRTRENFTAPIIKPDGGPS